MRTIEYFQIFMKTQKYKKSFFSCSWVSQWELPPVIGNGVVGNLALRFRLKKITKAIF